MSTIHSSPNQQLDYPGIIRYISWFPEVSKSTLDSYLMVRGLTKSQKVDIACEALRKMPGEHITYDYVDQLLKIKKLSPSDKADIVGAALSKMHREYITHEYVDQLLKIKKLSPSDKADIVGDALSRMHREYITYDYVDQLLNIDKKLSPSDKADIVCAAISNMPKRFITHEYIHKLLSIKDLTVSDKKTIIGFALEKMNQDLISQDFIDQLLNIDGLIHSDKAEIAYAALEKMDQQHITTDFVVKLLNINGLNHSDKKYIAKLAFYKMKLEDIFNVIEKSDLKASYGDMCRLLEGRNASEVIEQEHTLDSILNEIMRRSRVAVNTSNLRNIPAMSVFILADIVNKEDLFLKRVKMDVIQDFTLRQDHAYVQEHESELIVLKKPLDSDYRNLPTFEKLCEVVYDKAQEVMNLPEYQRIKNTPLASYQLGLSCSNKKLLKETNDAFRTIFTATNNKEAVKQFLKTFSKAIGHPNLFLGEDGLFVISNENLQKIYDVFTSNQASIKYLFTDEERARNLIYQTLYAGDGCVANFATHFDIALHNALITSFPERKALNALERVFLDINKIMMDGNIDILGGSSTVQFLNAPALKDATINPVGFVNVIAESITAEDLRNIDQLEKTFPNFAQAYRNNATDSALIQDDLCKDILALEILKLLVPEQYRVIEDVYYHSLKAIKTPEEIALQKGWIQQGCEQDSLSAEGRAAVDEIMNNSNIFQSTTSHAHGAGLIA